MPCTFAPYCLASTIAYRNAPSAAGQKSVANKMFFRAIRALVATALLSHLLTSSLYAESGIADVIPVNVEGEGGHFPKTVSERCCF
jgi:hypothetical protein